MTDRSKRNITPGKGEISTFMDCPDRIVDEYGVADCMHTDRIPPFWICSCKREIGECPRGYAR